MLFSNMSKRDVPILIDVHLYYLVRFLEHACRYMFMVFKVKYMCHIMCMRCSNFVNIIVH